MFISVELASVRIQLSLLAPQFSHGGGSTPTETAITPCRNDGVGLQLRGQKIGNVDLTNCSVRSELGFDV
jgi:hypothetical protein